MFWKSIYFVTDAPSFPVLKSKDKKKKIPEKLNAVWQNYGAKLYRLFFLLFVPFN